MSKLAINGGNKVRTSPFPAWPHYDETEREALNRVLDSRNWWANQGKEVKEFEKEWSAFTGAKASFAVTNGTHTLEVIFLALGIGDGDEGLVPIGFGFDRAGGAEQRAVRCAFKAYLDDVTSHS